MVANFQSRIDSGDEDVKSVLQGNSVECSGCVSRIIVEINERNFKTTKGREYRSKLLASLRLLKCLLERTDLAVIEVIWFERFSTVVSNELNLSIDKLDEQINPIVAEDLIKTALHFIELYPSPKFGPIRELCTSLLASKSIVRGTFYCLEEEVRLQSSLKNLFSHLHTAMNSDTDCIIKLVSNQLIFILETFHMIQRQSLVSLINKYGFWGTNEKLVITTAIKNLSTRLYCFLECLAITSIEKFVDFDLLKIVKDGCKFIQDFINNDYISDLSVEKCTSSSHLFNVIESIHLLEQAAESYQLQIEDLPFFKDFYAWYQKNEEIGLNDKERKSTEFLLFKYFFELLNEIYGVAACTTKLTFDRLPQNSNEEGANTEIVNAIFASFDIHVNTVEGQKEESASSNRKVNKRKNKRRKSKKSTQKTKKIVALTTPSDTNALSHDQESILETPKQIEPLPMPIEELQPPLILAPKKIKVFKNAQHVPVVKSKNEKDHNSSQDSILCELAKRNVSPSKLLKVLKKEGWYKERSHGSHAIMRCMGISGSISVPTNQSKLKTGTLHAIKKQVDDLRATVLKAVH